MNKDKALKELPGRLRRLRKHYKDRRATKVGFAEMINTHENYIKPWEEGRVPGADILIKICAETGCSAHWLLTGEGEMFGPEPTKGLNERYASLLWALGWLKPNYSALVVLQAAQLLHNKENLAETNLLFPHWMDKFPVRTVLASLKALLKELRGGDGQSQGS